MERSYPICVDQASTGTVAESSNIVQQLRAATIGTGSPYESGQSQADSNYGRAIETGDSESQKSYDEIKSSAASQILRTDPAETKPAVADSEEDAKKHEQPADAGAGAGADAEEKHEQPADAGAGTGADAEEKHEQPADAGASDAEEKHEQPADAGAGTGADAEEKHEQPADAGASDAEEKHEQPADAGAGTGADAEEKHEQPADAGASDAEEKHEQPADAGAGAGADAEEKHEQPADAGAGAGADAEEKHEQSADAGASDAEEKHEQPADAGAGAGADAEEKHEQPADAGAGADAEEKHEQPADAGASAGASDAEEKHEQPADAGAGAGADAEEKHEQPADAGAGAGADAEEKQVESTAPSVDSSAIDAAASVSHLMTSLGGYTDAVAALEIAVLDRIMTREEQKRGMMGMVRGLRDRDPTVPLAGTARKQASKLAYDLRMSGVRLIESIAAWRVACRCKEAVLADMEPGGALHASWKEAESISSETQGDGSGDRSVGAVLVSTVDKLKPWAAVGAAAGKGSISMNDPERPWKGRPSLLPSYLPFMWYGRDYVESMLHDLDPVAGSALLCEAFGIAAFHMVCNPLLTPTNLASNDRAGPPAGTSGGSAAEASAREQVQSTLLAELRAFDARGALPPRAEMATIADRKAARALVSRPFDLPASLPRSPSNSPGKYSSGSLPQSNALVGRSPQAPGNSVRGSRGLAIDLADPTGAAALGLQKAAVLTALGNSKVITVLEQKRVSQATAVLQADCEALRLRSIGRGDDPPFNPFAMQGDTPHRVAQAADSLLDPSLAARRTESELFARGLASPSRPGTSGSARPRSQSSTRIGKRGRSRGGSRPRSRPAGSPAALDPGSSQGSRGRRRPGSRSTKSRGAGRKKKYTSKAAKGSAELPPIVPAGAEAGTSVATDGPPRDVFAAVPVASLARESIHEHIDAAAATKTGASSGDRQAGISKQEQTPIRRVVRAGQSPASSKAARGKRTAKKAPPGARKKRKKSQMKLAEVRGDNKSPGSLKQFQYDDANVPNMQPDGSRLHLPEDDRKSSSPRGNHTASRASSQPSSVASSVIPSRAASPSQPLPASMTDGSVRLFGYDEKQLNVLRERQRRRARDARRKRQQLQAGGSRPGGSTHLRAAPALAAKSHEGATGRARGRTTKKKSRIAKGARRLANDAVLRGTISQRAGAVIESLTQLDPDRQRMLEFAMDPSAPVLTSGVENRPALAQGGHSRKEFSPSPVRIKTRTGSARGGVLSQGLQTPNRPGAASGEATPQLGIEVTRRSKTYREQQRQRNQAEQRRSARNYQIGSAQYAAVPGNDPSSYLPGGGHASNQRTAHASNENQASGEPYAQRPPPGVDTHPSPGDAVAALAAPGLVSPSDRALPRHRLVSPSRSALRSPSVASGRRSYHRSNDTSSSHSPEVGPAMPTEVPESPDGSFLTGDGRTSVASKADSHVRFAMGEDPADLSACYRSARIAPHVTLTESGQRQSRRAEDGDEDLTDLTADGEDHLRGPSGGGLEQSSAGSLPPMFEKQLVKDAEDLRRLASRERQRAREVSLSPGPGRLPQYPRHKSSGKASAASVRNAVDGPKVPDRFSPSPMHPDEDERAAAAARGFDAATLLQLQQPSVPGIRTDASVPRPSPGAALPPEQMAWGSRRTAGDGDSEAQGSGVVHAPQVGRQGRHADASRRASDRLKRLRQLKNRSTKRRQRRQKTMERHFLHAQESAAKQRGSHVASAPHLGPFQFGMNLKLDSQHDGRVAARAAPTRAKAYANKPVPSPYRMGGPDMQPHAHAAAYATKYASDDDSSMRKRRDSHRHRRARRPVRLAPLPVELVLPLSAAPEAHMREQLGGKSGTSTSKRAAVRAQLMKPLRESKASQREMQEKKAYKSYYAAVEAERDRAKEEAFRKAERDRQEPGGGHPHRDSRGMSRHTESKGGEEPMVPMQGRFPGASPARSVSYQEQVATGAALVGGPLSRAAGRFDSQQPDFKGSPATGRSSALTEALGISPPRMNTDRPSYADRRIPSYGSIHQLRQQMSRASASRDASRAAIGETLHRTIQETSPPRWDATTEGAKKDPRRQAAAGHRRGSMTAPIDASRAASSTIFQYKSHTLVHHVSYSDMRASSRYPQVSETPRFEGAGLRQGYGARGNFSRGPAVSGYGGSRASEGAAYWHGASTAGAYASRDPQAGSIAGSRVGHDQDMGMQSDAAIDFRAQFRDVYSRTYQSSVGSQSGDEMDALGLSRTGGLPSRASLGGSPTGMQPSPGSRAGAAPSSSGTGVGFSAGTPGSGLGRAQLQALERSAAQALRNSTEHILRGGAGSQSMSPGGRLPSGASNPTNTGSSLRDAQLVMPMPSVASAPGDAPLAPPGGGSSNNDYKPRSRPPSRGATQGLSSAFQGTPPATYSRQLGSTSVASSGSASVGGSQRLHAFPTHPGPELETAPGQDDRVGAAPVSSSMPGTSSSRPVTSHTRGAREQADLHARQSMERSAASALPQSAMEGLTKGSSLAGAGLAAGVSRNDQTASSIALGAAMAAIEKHASPRAKDTMKREASSRHAYRMGLSGDNGFNPGDQQSAKSPGRALSPDPRPDRAIIFTSSPIASRQAEGGIYKRPTGPVQTSGGSRSPHSTGSVGSAASQRAQGEIGEAYRRAQELLRGDPMDVDDGIAEVSGGHD